MLKVKINDEDGKKAYAEADGVADSVRLKAAREMAAKIMEILDDAIPEHLREASDD